MGHGRGRGHGGGQGRSAEPKVPSETSRNAPARTVSSHTTRSSKQRSCSADISSPIERPMRRTRGVQRLPPESDDDMVAPDSEEQGAVPPTVCSFLIFIFTKISLPYQSPQRLLSLLSHVDEDLAVSPTPLIFTPAGSLPHSCQSRLSRLCPLLALNNRPLYLVMIHSLQVSCLSCGILLTLTPITQLWRT